LILLPFLVALIYLIARERGMAERQAGAVRQAQADTDQYIKSVAGTTSPADQIASAKTLLDSGSITPGRVRTAEGQGPRLIHRPHPCRTLPNPVETNPRYPLTTKDSAVSTDVDEMGPIDYLVVEFPGNRLTGEVPTTRGRRAPVSTDIKRPATAD
jgi:hypothetical protein